MGIRKFLDECTKAVVAFVTTGYGAYQLAAGETSAYGATVTRDEWINVILTAALVAVGVWAVPNAAQSLKQ